MRKSRVKIHQNSKCRNCKRKLKYGERFDMSVGALNPAKTGNTVLPIHKVWNLRCWIIRGKLAIQSYRYTRGKNADY